jgi:hypothetical protein
MWYEIRTGSTECIDEVRRGGKGKGKAVADMDPNTSAEGEGDASMVSEVLAEVDDFENIGAVEEDEPERVARLKVCQLSISQSRWNKDATNIIGIDRDRPAYRA